MDHVEGRYHFYEWVNYQLAGRFQMIPIHGGSLLSRQILANHNGGQGQ